MTKLSNTVIICTRVVARLPEKKEALLPNFNVGYFTSLSILVFAVGGCEKISPYVNKVENPGKGFPKGLLKKNKYGAYVKGIWMVVILSGSLILIQSFGKGAADVLKQLTKLNSVCMPLRYCWVFIAYLALRKAFNLIHADYRFVPESGRCQVLRLVVPDHHACLLLPRHVRRGPVHDGPEHSHAPRPGGSRPDYAGHCQAPAEQTEPGSKRVKRFPNTAPRPSGRGFILELFW